MLFKSDCQLAWIPLSCSDSQIRTFYLMFPTNQDILRLFPTYLSNKSGHFSKIHQDILRMVPTNPDNSAFYVWFQQIWTFYCMFPTNQDILRMFSTNQVKVAFVVCFQHIWTFYCMFPQIRTFYRIGGLTVCHGLIAPTTQDILRLFPTNQDNSAFYVCFQSIRTFYRMFPTNQDILRKVPTNQDISAFYFIETCSMDCCSGCVPRLIQTLILRLIPLELCHGVLRLQVRRHIAISVAPYFRGLCRDQIVSRIECPQFL